MTQDILKRDQLVKVRVTPRLRTSLQQKAHSKHMSLSGYVNFVLTSSFREQAVYFDEKIGLFEKKDKECRLYFTRNEMDLLKQQAILNDWSVTKEVRYRVVSSLAYKPKLNKPELKALYALRSSLNVLGANINRLVREGDPLSENNIDICIELVTLMKELKGKISSLEKCSSSRFRLKNVGDINGRSR